MPVGAATIPPSFHAGWRGNRSMESPPERILIIKIFNATKTVFNTYYFLCIITMV
jgi:hypothetical protein